MQGRTACVINGMLVAVLAVGALAGSALAAPVSSASPLVLSPNTEVTLRPSGEGFEATDTRRVTTRPEGQAPDADATQESTSQAEVTLNTPAGTIRFSFWASPQAGARLKLENRSGRAIIYSAELVRRGSRQGEPTTICSVPDELAGYELWPDDITAIRITGFYPAPAGSVVCGNPETGAVGAPPPNEQPSGGK